MAAFPATASGIRLDKVREGDAQLNLCLSKLSKHLARPREIKEVQLPHFCLVEGADAALHHQRERVVRTP